MITFAQAQALRIARLEAAITAAVNDKPDSNIEFLWQQWAAAKAGSSTSSGGATSPADIALGIDASIDIEAISDSLFELVNGQLDASSIGLAVDQSAELIAINQAVTTQIQPELNALRISLSHFQLRPRMFPVDLDISPGSEGVLFSPSNNDAFLWGYSLVFSEPAKMRLRDDTSGNLAFYEGINAASEHFANPATLSGKLFATVENQANGLNVKVTGFIFVAETTA